ncbi:MAG: hypothetical protein JWQ48_3903 [Conexibacter sp.]|jgi:hypothetical protein|nr:hypothetical protein [Conexibacter sp.]
MSSDAANGVVLERPARASNACRLQLAQVTKCYPGTVADRDAGASARAFVAELVAAAER